jgi:hypothetical protein
LEKKVIKELTDRLTVEEEIRKAQKRFNYNTLETPLEFLFDKKENENGEVESEICPDKNKGLTWTDDERSRFIESILIGIPITPVVLARVRQKKGRIFFRLDIIDGNHRIDTIIRFANNELELCGLKILQSLNGFKYQDLLSDRQRKFSRTTLRVIMLEPSVDEEMREEIRERLGSH